VVPVFIQEKYMVTFSDSRIYTPEGSPSKNILRILSKFCSECGR